MNQQTRLRVSENGRVVIPASFRKALGIEVGDEVVLELKQDELRITTQQQRILRARERARKYLPKGVSLSKELLAERREAERKHQIHVRQVRAEVLVVLCEGRSVDPVSNGAVKFAHPIEMSRRNGSGSRGREPRA